MVWDPVFFFRTSKYPNQSIRGKQKSPQPPISGRFGHHFGARTHWFLTLGFQLLKFQNLDRPASIDDLWHCLHVKLMPSRFVPVFDGPMLNVISFCVYVGCDRTVFGLVVHTHIYVYIYLVSSTNCISISILDISNICWYMYLESGIKCPSNWRW